MDFNTGQILSEIRNYMSRGITEEAQSRLCSPNRIRYTEAHANRLLKRAQAQAKEVEHSKRLANTGLDEYFGANTDERCFHDLLLTEMHLAIAEHSTATTACDVMQTRAIPAFVLEAPLSWHSAANSAIDKESASILKNRNRVKKLESRARRIKRAAKEPRNRQTTYNRSGGSLIWPNQSGGTVLPWMLGSALV